MAQQEWEDGRASLVKIIEKENPQGSSANQVTILFDGRPGRIDTPGTVKVKIIFTDEQSADDRIKRIVAEASHKKSYIVVTDDREVRYYVRSLGAKVLKVTEFLSKVKSHQDKQYSEQKSAITERETKLIPPSVQDKITNELEQVWLNKKKNKH